MTEEIALNPMQQLEQREPTHLPKLQLLANPLLWKDFLDEESGQDMIEYVLVAALLGLVSITAVNGLGAKISTAYSSLATNLTSNT
jgi:pilus assembly protein Flp/PilA